MNEIERCNLVYKVGAVLNKNEWEISFITVRNDITSSHLSFMNSVSMRFKKKNNLILPISFLIPFGPSDSLTLK